MQAIVRVVEPPFAIDIDEFALSFEEVSVVLGFPSYAASVVSKCSIGRIPVGDDAAIGAERAEIHDCNGPYGVETGGVDRFIEPCVNACFRTGVGEPTNRVSIV